jgi:hypothetical protein
MRTINKIYIGVSVVLVIVLAYLAYRFLLKGKGSEGKEKEKYFKILDQNLAETLAYIKVDPHPAWRLKIKLGACTHGVTFEQALARDLSWAIEHNGLKVKTSTGEYSIPLLMLLQWRDARDGRSPHYGKNTTDPACTKIKKIQIYREENQIPPAQ